MRSVLASRGESLRVLHVELRFEQERGAPREPRRDTLQPAEPTLDMAQVLGLVVLRLEAAVVDPEGRPVLVRCILGRPRQLADQRPGPDGWPPGGLAEGPVIRLCGMVERDGWSEDGRSNLGG
jgi:hypothetical protein